MTCKRSFSFDTCRTVFVPFSVDVNYQSGKSAIKRSDETVDNLVSAEVKSCKLSTVQQPPQIVVNAFLFVP